MAWREDATIGKLRVEKSLTLANTGNDTAIVTGLSISSEFTTGISISGDGTTAFGITSGFTGTTMLSLGGTATNGINISGACTTGLNLSGSMTDGISFANTVTGDFIDFSGVTYVPTGSNGPSLIRCGTYANPLSHSVEAQSGLMRWYMETDANGTSYDRGLFVCLKTTGTKSIFPGAFLAEVKDQAGAGPVSCMAGQFISHLNSATAAMPASSSAQGLFGVWAKITANEGATVTTGCYSAPIWLDNQLNGSNIGSGGSLNTEYGIFATTGGSRPRGFVGFQTTSSGYYNLFSFDSTYSTSVSPCNGGAVATNTGGSTGSLKMEIDGTAYLIPYFAA